MHTCIRIGLIRTEAELKEAVSILLPELGYVLCPGIPVEMYKDCLEVVRFHSREVQCLLEVPYERCEATKLPFVAQTTLLKDASVSPNAQFMQKGSVSAFKSIISHCFAPFICVAIQPLNPACH